jgi:hypothetical protein
MTITLQDILSHSFQQQNLFINLADRNIVVTIAYEKKGGNYGYHTEPISDFEEQELIDLLTTHPFELVDDGEWMLDIIVDVGKSE